MPRWALAQALAALAMELDPELVRALANAGEDLQRIFVPSMFDWSPLADALRLSERKQKLLAELLRRVQAGTWRLVWLPDDPSQDAEALAEDRLADLVPENLDIEKSEVILGEQHYRARVELPQGQRHARPTFDLVKSRVEEALAQGRISSEVFDGATEEAMRARFHRESRTARNVVRAVRYALRRVTAYALKRDKFGPEAKA